jgi:hypothetical protein
MIYDDDDGALGVIYDDEEIDYAFVDTGYMYADRLLIVAAIEHNGDYYEPPHTEYDPRTLPPNWIA